jgi:hypothetical protein
MSVVTEDGGARRASQSPSDDDVAVDAGHRPVSELEPTDEELALKRLDPALLRRRWRSLMGRSAPQNLPRSLMIRILLWKQQVARTGDLDPRTIARLEASLDDPGSSGDAASASCNPGRRELRPGTVLVREHAGALHRVMALERGFAWNGQIFSSLSGVARAITGINWNGHRFFGLPHGAQKRSLSGRKLPASSVPTALPDHRDEAAP